MNLKTTSTPADFEALSRIDLSQTTCVVFDILRATSAMVTALAHGAEAIRPAASIEEALAQKAEHPTALLGGERDGLRITAAQTGGIEFDLGNSPREYTAEIVAGKKLITTTTNGTRALRACAAARQTLVASFLNLTATADYLRETKPANLVLVCSGTHEQAALEDTLAAGAIAEELGPAETDDATEIARQLYRQHAANLEAGMAQARNGRRLLSVPDLADDVSFCAQRDVCHLVAEMDGQGWVRKI